MKFTVVPAICLLVFAASVLAQQKPADDPAGESTVSGHVYCSDTNSPARMANVVLLPVESLEATRSGQESKVTYHGETAQTLFDGSFSLKHVAPGSYYVVASLPGYISPAASLIAVPGKPNSDDGSSKTGVSAPRITVQAGLPVAVNVTIERGAAVSGRVSYDDGSPASGLRVTVLVRVKHEWVPIPSSQIGYVPHSAETDDRGNYRISGLSTQQYLVEVDLNLVKSTYRVESHGGGTSMETVSSLAFYSGGATRLKDGVPVPLTAGDDRSGADIEIPISKLHVVRGNVVAAKDGHVLNGGEVVLLYPDDGSQVNRAGVNREDEAFTFNFVPEGDYILRVYGASDNDYEEIPNPPHSSPPTRTETHALHSYGSADRPIHVDRDLTSVVVDVPELPNPKSQ